MTILVLYATTEGQTRKIAGRAADHLTITGHSVALLSAAEADGISLDQYARTILLASVHAGRYQPEFLAFATSHKAALEQIPNVFISVSLSAASTDSEDIQGIAACVDKMIAETGWTPGQVKHVAGAFRFTQYDFLKSWAMRWIANKKDPEVNTSGDTEYTDWDGLYRFLDDWMGVTPK